MSGDQESLSDPRDVTIRQQAETIRQMTVRLKELEAEVMRLLALLEGKAAAKTAKKPGFQRKLQPRSKQEQKEEAQEEVDWPKADSKQTYASDSNDQRLRRRRGS